VTRRSAWFVAAWAAPFLACGPGPVVEPAPVPDPVAAERERPRRAAERAQPIAARGWLPAGEVPGDTVFGFAALLQPPATDDDQRNMAFCIAVHQALPPGSTVTVGEPVITYWPVRGVFLREPPTWTPAVARSACDALLANYPYDVGQVYAQMAGLAGVRGPILIALRRRSAGHPEFAFAFDLSNAPDDEIRRAVMVWRQEITRRAVRWPRLAFIREHTRWILNGIEIPFLVIPTTD
jgi:hypothetical protein